MEASFNRSFGRWNLYRSLDSLGLTMFYTKVRTMRLSARSEDLSESRKDRR
jgi:hypothetical protein